MGFMKASRKPAAQAQEQATIDKQEIKQKEDDRQERIKAGRSAIDSTFDSKFNSDYYNKYKDDYTGYYNPQLDDKFAKSKQDLIYALARQGIGSSTAAATELGNADKALSEKKLQVSSEATDAANTLQAQVEKQRSGAYAMNEASADPAAATNRAAAEATALSAPQSFSPLGDIFAGLASNVAGFAQGLQSNARSPWYTGNWSGGSSKGSSKVTG